MKTFPQLLEELANDDDLMEIGREAVEATLIEFRDSRISALRNNGFVIKECDGSPSEIIRFGPEVGVGIALKAIANWLKEHPEYENSHE